MSDLERILPVAAMIIIGTMLINGTTLPGIACIVSVVIYYYARTK